MTAAYTVTIGQTTGRVIGVPYAYRLQIDGVPEGNYPRYSYLDEAREACDRATAKQNSRPHPST